MAEFCLECFKRDFGNKHYKRRHVALDWDLCEGCGEWKECVVTIRYEPFWFIIWW